MVEVKFPNAEVLKFSEDNLKVINQIIADNINLHSYLNNALPDPNSLNESELDVLKHYFRGLINSHNSEPFVSYSIAVENVIVSSNFTEKSKALLLSIMSSVRHGIGYWKN